MDDHDVGIRNFIYRQFVETQRPPDVDDVAREFELERDESEAAFRRLHDAHALVLEPGSLRLLMLNPFSCVPTPHRVEADARWWYANCGWDAFGILAALGLDGRVSSSCPDCAQPIEITLRDGVPTPDDDVFHTLLPATQWWDDIVFN